MNAYEKRMAKYVKNVLASPTIVTKEQTISELMDNNYRYKISLLVDQSKPQPKYKGLRFASN